MGCGSHRNQLRAAKLARAFNYVEPASVFRASKMTSLPLWVVREPFNSFHFLVRYPYRTPIYTLYPIPEHPMCLEGSVLQAFGLTLLVWGFQN